MLYDAKRRATKFGIPFTITKDDIVVPEVCPILGIKLKRGGRGGSASSPSLDRVIPALGYIKSNIQVISNKANAMKNDATFEEIEMLYLHMSRVRQNEPV
jgi:hypothetical protein